MQQQPDTWARLRGWLARGYAAVSARPTGAAKTAQPASGATPTPRPAIDPALFQDALRSSTGATPEPMPDSAAMQSAMRGMTTTAVPEPQQADAPNPLPGGDIRRDPVVRGIHDFAGGLVSTVTGGQRDLGQNQVGGPAGDLLKGIGDPASTARDFFKTADQPSVLDMAGIGAFASPAAFIGSEGVAGEAAAASRSLAKQAIKDSIGSIAADRMTLPGGLSGGQGGVRLTKAMEQNAAVGQMALEDAARAEWEAKQAALPVRTGTSPEPGAIGAKGGGGADFGGNAPASPVPTVTDAHSKAVEAELARIRSGAKGRGPNPPPGYTRAQIRAEAEALDAQTDALAGSPYHQQFADAQKASIEELAGVENDAAKLQTDLTRSAKLAAKYPEEAPVPGVERPNAFEQTAYDEIAARQAKMLEEAAAADPELAARLARGARSRQAVTAAEQSNWTPPPVDNLARLESAKPPPPPTLIQGIRKVMASNFLMKARVQGVDRNAPLAPLQRETGVAAHSAAQLVPGAQVKGEQIVMQHFAPVIDTVPQADRRALEDLMDLYTSMDRAAQGHSLPGGIQGPAGVNDAIERLRARIGQQRFTVIDQAARQLWDLHDQWVVGEKFRAGIIDGDHASTLSSVHPHYFPQNRADFEGLGFNGAHRAEASLSSTGIKAAVGSERMLAKDRLHTYLGQVVQTQMDIARNDAAKTIVDALVVRERQTGTPMARVVTPGQAGEHSNVWETISFLDGGQVHQVEVPALIGQVAKGLEAQPDHAFFRVMSALSQPLRSGATTLNAGFIPVNLIRDAGSVLLKEKMSIVTHAPDYVAGMIAAITHNQLYQDAAMQKALQGTLQDTISRASKVDQFRTPTGIRFVGNAALWPVHRLEDLNLAVEQTSRLAVFRKLGREGVSEIERAVRTRDATVDFSKAGLTAQWVNQLLPFSNAAIQGSTNTLRVLKENPRWFGTVAGIFAAPTMLSRVNNMRFDSSDQIPDYVYTQNWVVQVGEYVRQDGTRGPIALTIPKGQVGSLMTFFPEALFNAARASDNRNAASLVLQGGMDAVSAASPIDVGNNALTGLIGRNPVVGGIAGLGFKKDPYTGAAIIPQGEQGRLPEQQFGKDTTALAVLLGQKTHTSPRMWDFGIREYTAGAGQSAAWAVSLGLEGAGFQPELYGSALAKTQEKNAATTIEQVAKAPVVSRFLSTRDTQLERQGWEAFGKASTETNRALLAIPGVNALALTLTDVSPKVDLVKDAPSTAIALTPSQMTEWQARYGALAVPAVASLLPQLSGSGDDKKAAVQALLTDLKSQSVQAVLDKVPRPQDPVQQKAWDFRQVVKTLGYDDIKTGALASASPATRLLYAMYSSAPDKSPARLIAQGGPLADPASLRTVLTIDAQIRKQQAEMRQAHPELEIGLVQYRNAAPMTAVGQAYRQAADKAQAAKRAA